MGCSASSKKKQKENCQETNLVSVFFLFVFVGGERLSLKNFFKITKNEFQAIKDLFCKHFSRQSTFILHVR